MLSLIIALILIGLAVYIIGLLPIDGRIKQVIQAVAIVLALIYVLKMVWPMVGLG